MLNSCIMFFCPKSKKRNDFFQVLSVASGIFEIILEFKLRCVALILLYGCANFVTLK